MYILFFILLFSIWRISKFRHMNKWWSWRSPSHAHKISQVVTELLNVVSQNMQHVLHLYVEESLKIFHLHSKFEPFYLHRHWWNWFHLEKMPRNTLALHVPNNLNHHHFARVSQWNLMNHWPTEMTMLRPRWVSPLSDLPMYSCTP